MDPTTIFSFHDEIDAIIEETRWAHGLDDGKAPFREEAHAHVGEGGATTAYYQHGKLVGIAARFRDQWNRTTLVLMDRRLIPA